MLKESLGLPSDSDILQPKEDIFFGNDLAAPSDTSHTETSGNINHQLQSTSSDCTFNILANNILRDMNVPSVQSKFTAPLTNGDIPTDTKPLNVPMGVTDSAKCLQSMGIASPMIIPPDNDERNISEHRSSVPLNSWEDIIGDNSGPPSGYNYTMNDARTFHIPNVQWGFNHKNNDMGKFMDNNAVIFYTAACRTLVNYMLVHWKHTNTTGLINMVLSLKYICFQVDKSSFYPPPQEKFIKHLKMLVSGSTKGKVT